MRACVSNKRCARAARRTRCCRCMVPQLTARDLHLGRGSVRALRAGRVANVRPPLYGPALDSAQGMRALLMSWPHALGQAAAQGGAKRAALVSRLAERVG
jgi:hypothetical protein